VRLVHQPVLAQLQVHHVALFQVDDLVGHAGQGHGVAGQEVFLPVFAHAQDQRRTGARADHPVRLVLAEHRNRIGAVQLHGGLDGLEQVAVVQAVDQVGNDFGVGLAGEHIALGLVSAARSSSWFSMMPLCTSAMRPGRLAESAPGPWLKCGCALCTAGAPWVAQRVWAMPVVPPSIFSALTCSISSATRAVLRARCRPSRYTATPQES
jgi:hypothetical protein